MYLSNQELEKRSCMKIPTVQEAHSASTLNAQSQIDLFLRPALLNITHALNTCFVLGCSIRVGVTWPDNPRTSVLLIETLRTELNKTGWDFKITIDNKHAVLVIYAKNTKVSSR